MEMAMKTMITDRNMYTKEGTSEHTSIEISGPDDMLVSSIQAKLISKSPVSSNCCIFKAPELLSRHNEKAFLPTAVAIGPYHRHTPSLEPMKLVKLWYLHALLARSPTANNYLKLFVQAMRKNEERARECYVETIQLSSDEFVEMLILDGCFIIELFRREAAQVSTDKNDPLFNMSFTLDILSHDLMLLENQIPFFVLECLFNLTTTPEKGKITLEELALNFFRRVLPLTVGVNLDFLPRDTKHLLDLLRNSLLLSPEAKYDPNYEAKWELIPSATALVRAGVKFSVGNAGEILRVRFKNGVLEIPPLIIHEDTEALFRNLIAYEQCDHHCSDAVASYVVLLDCLVNSEKDVELLVNQGIFRNWLSHEDVSLMFRRLHNDASVNVFHFADLCERVNAYYQANSHKCQVVLKRGYLKNPWITVSVAAAAILLILSFLQTLFSILEYAR